MGEGRLQKDAKGKQSRANVSVFQQMPLPSACTASRKAGVSCLPAHPSATRSLGLHPPSCEKTSLQLFPKNHWKGPGPSAGRESKKVILIHSRYCQSSLYLFQVSLPRKQVVAKAAVFKYFSIPFEMCGPSAAHWIFMVYTNHRFRLI